MKSLAWIGEWAPTDFSCIQPLEIIILAGLALGFSGKVQAADRCAAHASGPHPRRAVTRTQRAAAWHCRRADPGEPFGTSLARGRREKRLGMAWRRWRPVQRMVAVAALAARIAFCPWAGDELARPSPPHSIACRHRLRAQPVLNEYGLGGQLIFNGVRSFHRQPCGPLRRCFPSSLPENCHSEPRGIGAHSCQI